MDVRHEYPRPQLIRDRWMSLNGLWDFAVDDSQDLQAPFDRKILVPFCPESPLSGIGNRAFMTHVRYRTWFSVPPAWQGKRLILHFGAVDYQADIFLNGKFVGSHTGGYTPFSFDITDDAEKVGSDNELIVLVTDETRSPVQPTGKQSLQEESAGCFYTRTTGIWQTVWIEPVDTVYVRGVDYACSVSAPSVTVKLHLGGDFRNHTVHCVTSFGGVATGEATVVCLSGHVEMCIPLTETHLWEVGCGRLYDVRIDILDGDRVRDRVVSYFGLREVGLSDRAFLLNGEAVFLRTVLDQGFYPDGIYTAPTDEALHNDILYAKELGFNGARLHEKVFEPRYLYWADREGFLVWGEYPNWGLSLDRSECLEAVLAEVLDEIARDRSHPSIIGWCPFNETWGYVQNPIVKMVYVAVKSVDPSRPVIDTSGNYHTITDIFDVHDYEQDPETFAACYRDMDRGVIRDQVFRRPDGPESQTYAGEPVYMSEYGGIRWTTQDGWGYGSGPETEEEFLNRYRKLTETLLFHEHFMGFCYTQLYDVEREQNGLLTYERIHKFDPAVIRAVNTQKAAIES